MAIIEIESESPVARYRDSLSALFDPPSGAAASVPEASLKEAAQAERKRQALLTLAALGVVFGDIGTSPLYALRQCFLYVDPTRANVLGVLSLIFWALFLIISVKYMLFILKADNDGEGGILALMALAVRGNKKTPWLLGLGLFGAALLYGDGMITPAISVLGAIEG